MAQIVKNLPAVQATQVQFLGWEDPLEKGMAIHFSILAWRILWTQGAWRATVHRVTKISYNFQASLVAQMVNNLPASIHGIFQARVLEWGAIAFSDI